jgi:hypothetical protein
MNKDLKKPESKVHCCLSKVKMFNELLFVFDLLIQQQFDK